MKCRPGNADSLLQVFESSATGSTSTAAEEMIDIGTVAEGRTRRRTRARHAEDEADEVARILTQPRRLHPHRRNPLVVCHFDGLAAVEVQSIMQMIDRRSLMRLARCSKRLHTDADSDAAWQTQPPFDLVLGRGTIAPLVAHRFLRSLLSHVGATRIRSAFDPNPHGPLEEDINAALTLPRITELDDWQCYIHTHQWHRILHHPAMAGVTAITIGWHAPYDVVNHLVHLPRLHTLDLRPDVIDPTTGVRGIDASALSSLASLTSLGVHAMAFSNSSVLPAIAACTHLTRLRLVEARLRGGEFRRLLTSPSMSRLQRLVLVNFPALSAEEYPDAFASMTDLRHLELRDLRGIDSLLAGVSRATHLATIEIDCALSADHALFFPPPSMAAVQSLIAQTEATSRVHITLLMSISIESGAFAALDPKRFTLLVTDEEY